MGGLASAFQQDCIARSDCESRDLRPDIGAGLEYGGNHADRRLDFTQHEPFVQFRFGQRAAHRVFHLCHLRNSCQHIA